MTIWTRTEPSPRTKGTSSDRSRARWQIGRAPRPGSSTIDDPFHEISHPIDQIKNRQLNRVGGVILDDEMAWCCELRVKIHIRPRVEPFLRPPRNEK